MSWVGAAVEVIVAYQAVVESHVGGWVSWKFSEVEIYGASVLCESAGRKKLYKVGIKILTRRPQVEV